jgi:hypothetical protein
MKHLFAFLFVVASASWAQAQDLQCPSGQICSKTVLFTSTATSPSTTPTQSVSTPQYREETLPERINRQTAQALADIGPGAPVVQMPSAFPTYYRTMLPQYGYGYGGYSSYEIYGNGYVPYDYYFLGPCRSYLPPMERPVNCVQAALTFKIEESYLEDAILRVDGHNFGRVGNFRTRHVLPDRKFYLGADREHVIQITRYTENKQIQVWEDRIQAETIRMMNGRAIEIPVSEADFANAPYGLIATPSRDEISGKDLVMGKPKR